MIASGYLPYLFSENLCNAKLVLALKESGIVVDVISKKDEGPIYDNQWHAPWDQLRPNTYQIQYGGSRIDRLCDVIYSSLKMGHFSSGVRWVRRAYEQAQQLMCQNSYDAVLTRSPNDLAHLVGYKLRKDTGIKWIANWNDPADAIWPEPYTHHYSHYKQNRALKYARKMLQSADYITFPSDTLKSHFTSYFPELSSLKTEVIPHIGLVESVFKKVERDTPKNKFYLCHSGNLSKERDPELTFQALRDIINQGFSRFEFHIMGHINDYTQQLIQKYDLAEYVKCIGGYPYLTAINKLQQYDVLVLLEAKLKKGIFFASKFTDYAQTGLPILAISPTDGFANNMIKTYGGGILADNTNAKSIKDAIIQLIDLWKKGALSTISSSKMYEQFAPSCVVNQYIEIVNQNSIHNTSQV